MANRLFCMRAAAFAAVLFALLVASAQGQSAGPEEIYASAAIDDQGQLRIVTKDGREILPKKEDEQVGFSRPRVSDDGRSVGWLAEFPNSATSYPIPLKLMILTNARMRAFTGAGLPIWRWAFRERGRLFAFEQETVHGGFGIHYELRDVATGRLFDDYSPAYGPDNRLIPNQPTPSWVDELNALK
jgi:hypothetical protein